MIKKCEKCGKELNLNEDPTTTCSVCESVFCCVFDKECFFEHIKEKHCGGKALTILNPKWTVNLIQTEKN